MRHSYTRHGALVAISAIAACALSAQPALAKDKVVQLRILKANGDAIVDNTSFVTGTESIKTDPKAKCFTGGVGGSGDSVKLPGATALGTAISAGEAMKKVRPISVTDEFGFGLGVCAFGGIKPASSSEYWAVKVNGNDLNVGGDQAKVSKGDSVTWFLATSPPPLYPPPAPELRVSAPNTAGGDGEETVTVTQQSCVFNPEIEGVECSREPVEGANVTKGTGLTDANGHAIVSTPRKGTLAIKARKDGALHSVADHSCFNLSESKCPRPGERIIGRSQGDDFGGTSGDDDITARGGDDRVNLTGGGDDKVDCGKGKDTVVLKKGDKGDKIRRCERVVRK